MAGITLIGETGSPILTLPAVKNGDETVASGSFGVLALPQVPLGKYYVAPGYFMASNAQVELLKAVRAGESIGGGVPRLVVTQAGVEISLEFVVKEPIGELGP
jgi:hypothetical protein